MITTHPSELELEAAHFGEAESEVVAHLEGCEPCRQRLALFAKLEEELGALAQISIPVAVDEAVLARIPPRRRSVIRLAAYIAPVAAAAAILIALVSVGPLGDAQRGTTSNERGTATADANTPIADRRDLNGDGAVDIIDALVLARSIECGDRAAGRDFNGDDRIDERDVDRIAMAAVSLGRPF